MLEVELAAGLVVEVASVLGVVEVEVANLVEVANVVEAFDDETTPNWYMLRALPPPQYSEALPLHIMLQPVLRTGVWLLMAFPQSMRQSVMLS